MPLKLIVWDSNIGKGHLNQNNLNILFSSEINEQETCQ